jgi:hypothetical protein
MPWVEMYRGGMENIPPYPKPNRADFSDARAYKSAYEKWRYVTVPGAKERACQRSIQSRKNDPAAAEKRRAYQTGRYQNDDAYREKINAKNRKFAHDNPEYMKEKSRAYQQAHREEIRNQRVDYWPKFYEKNKEGERERYRRNYLANPDYYQVKSRIRQDGQLQATPKWLTKEQKAAISAVYREARKLTKLTGVKHVVDHIGPLNGRNSCGLHVPWNLQVIPEVENLRKGRKEPD